MKHRVQRFSIHQTSKTSAMVYGLLIGTVGIVWTLLGPKDNTSILLCTVLPPFYMLLAYIGTAMGCGIYNLVARLGGGIEVILEEEK